MSAATDNRNAAGLGAGQTYAEITMSWLGPVAAAVNLPTGTVAAQLVADTGTSPVIYPMTNTALRMPLGIVTAGFDNTGGAQGARPIAVLSKVGKFVDLNAGGGDAIAQTDRFKIAYCADNQTWSKLSTDGIAGGMIMGLDTDGKPMIGVGPMFLALARAWDGVGTIAGLTSLTDSSGGSGNNTLAAVTLPTALTDSSGGSASGTLAAVTAPTALTDNSGGAASATLAAVTAAANAGSADVGPVKDAIASLAARQAEDRAAIVALTNAIASLAARQAENRTAINTMRDNTSDCAAKANEIIAAVK